MTSEPPDNTTAIEHRLAWLTRLLGVGVLALVAVTWKLWTPQEVFPRVPLFRWAPPDWWDWASLALILTSGVGLLIRPPRHVRTFAATLAFGLALAFVCDQHRLQPWAWQFFILALLVALADDALLWNGWQWLTISIYFYSALSKFDADFLRSTASSFVQSVDHLFRVSHLPVRLLPQYYSRIAWIFPIGELICALLLTFSRGRTYGWIGASIMHLFLIRILGPYGVRHSWGVIVWNIFFMFQTLVLFAWTDLERLLRRYVWPKLIATSPRITAPMITFDAKSTWLAKGILGAALIAPAMTPWGWFDLWPGWAVYVRPYEDASIWADYDAMADATPEQLQGYALLIIPKHARQGALTDVSISADTLSYNALRVPDYPHLRCSLAVALDLAERIDGIGIRVQIRRRNRWGMLFRSSVFTLATTNSTLSSSEEIHQYCKRFWFNAYPTSMYRRAAREKVMSDDG